MGLSQQRFLEVLHDDQLHSYRYFGAHMCFQTIYACNFTNGYDVNTLRLSSCTQQSVYKRTNRVLGMRVCSASITVTPGHGIILILSANMDLSQLTLEKRKLILKYYLKMENVRYRGSVETNLELGARGRRLKMCYLKCKIL
jgi:hypothetical protein